MNCDETFNAGICYITDAYKRVCKFNNELHADLEKYRTDNVKLRKVLEAILQCAGETKRDKGCDACPMYDENGEVLVRDSWCHLFAALRELGIEVDDG